MVTSPVFPSLAFTLTITASYWCWVSFEAWIVARDRREVKGESLDRSSFTWVIAWLVVGIVVGVFATPVLLPRCAIRNGVTPVFIAGIALVWAGILLRYWAIATLGRWFRSKVVIQEGHALVTRGPYRYLRNPSYTGSLMTFLGFGLGVCNWLSVIVLSATGLAAFSRRIIVEDRALTGRFGREYQEYADRTWALLPFIW